MQTAKAIHRRPRRGERPPPVIRQPRRDPRARPRRQRARMPGVREDSMATKSSHAHSTSHTGSKGGRKINEVMKEHKQGTLKSGSGKKVKSRKQAVAIALSEARKSGAKVPRKKTS